MIRSTFARRAVTALTCVAALAGTVRAQDIYAFTDNATLIRFNSASPGSVTTVGTITGLTTGVLQSIDFRPATGQLYALSYELNTDMAQLYTINLGTAVATPVGGAVTLTGTGGANRVSIDFNPVTDLIRVVTAGTANSTSYRLNPTTGALVAQDTNLAFAAGDPHFGVQPYVASIAYSNNVPSASSTTLYGYDFGRDAVVTVGSVGGTPVSPNTGQLFTVGASGISSTFDTIGFDIGTGANAYLAAAEVSTGGFNDNLFSVNLTTGAVTNLGQIGPGLEVVDMAVTFAAVPEPTGLAFVGAGAVGVAYGVRKWRTRRRGRRGARRVAR